MVVQVRKATLEDVDQIMSIQRMSYRPELVESQQIFESIIRCDMSYVAIGFNRIVGFLLCHPSRINEVPMLHCEPTLFLENDICMFIHDLSVHPDWRSTGIASQLLKFLRRESPYNVIQLVSVNSTRFFWEVMGFKLSTEVVLTPEMRTNYGGDCKFMQCKLNRENTN